MKPWIVAFALLAPALFWSRAEARTFANAFVSFEMPDNWDCTQEETEWVCRHHEANAAKEALIIFTAKEAGATDSFEEYERHLATPQTTAAKSTGTSSQVISPPKRIVIQDQTWVESVHQDSEIKNYITRYMATVKDDIAIAFSFSAHKDAYTRYNGDFFKAAQTIKVVARKNHLANSQAVIPGQLPKMDNTVIDVTATPVTGAPGLGGSGNSKTKALLFIIAVITGAAAIVLLTRGKTR